VKPQHIPEACFASRLAPYALVVAVLGFGLSLLWIHPVPSYLGLGALSGILLSLFHVLKWRTGREGFQFAAMVSTFLPLLVLLHAHMATGPICQYFALFVSAYSGALVVLRRRIVTWGRS
jgi:hypothetical protein